MRHVGAIPAPLGCSYRLLPWLGAAVLFALVLSVSTLRAQTTVYWDINGVAAGAGGATPSGTWNTAGAANWNAVAAGTGAVSNWVAGRSAVFSAGGDATGTYTITLGAPMSVANLTFEEGSAIITGSTLTFTGTAISVAGGATATINSVLAGTAALNKTGAGTLFLTGANTYSRATTVSAGTLSINTIANVSGGNTALGAPTTKARGTIAIGATTTGATLAYTGTGSTSDRVINLAGTTGGATLDASGSGALTFTSALTATGAGSKTLTLAGTSTAANTLSGAIVNNSATNLTSLAKDGGGTWVLSGTAANTYTGTTTVNDGTLNLGKTAGVNAVGTGALTVGNSLGAASSANLVLLASNQIADTVAVTVNADGRLALGTFTESIASIAGTGLIDLGTSGYLTVGANNSSSTFGGAITGAGTLEKAGTGTLTFNSTISFTGSLTLSGGTLALNAVSLTVGTLHITGNTVLDFGNSTASTLNATTFLVDAGVTLSIINWINATDYFYAQNWTGATPDATGAIPMNQITFSGFSNSSTKWLSYDHQVTPVPEPAAYGACFAGLALAWALARRRGRAGSRDPLVAA